MRLGAVLYPPERQSVIVVAAQSPEFDTRGLEEAIQINFDYRDMIPQDKLMDRVLEIIKPAPFIVEDKRSQFSWGAEGRVVQELLIQYAAGFTSGLTVAGVLARLRRLSRRPEEVLTEEDESYISPATTADAAWHLFSGFLKSAFKVSSAQAAEVTEYGEEWRIRATGNGYRFEGRISKEGRISHARRVEG
jgi:hypothetical protein